MKFVSLLSSGIDSPVATYLMLKKADEAILLHGDIRPFTDNREIENFNKIAKHLKNLSKCKISAYVALHGENLSDYKQNCNSRFTCIFCKRMLLRYSEKLAEKENADAIIMGDSLGQVASQTLYNIKTIEQASTIPILRPLIGFDKEDIIKIAKRIGTYELSIAKSNPCGAVPNKPATMAKLEQILEQESKVNITKMVQKSIENLEQIKL